MVLNRINDKSIVLAARFSAQGIRVLSTSVIARLVAKGEFGRLEMIYAVAGVFSAVADFGIGRAVCNSPDLDDDEVRDTSLVMLVGFSLIFSLLAIAGGIYFDHFYSDSRLKWVGLIVAISYVCQYAQTSQLSNIARHLQFGRWGTIEFVATIASISVGVVVAVFGGGIFALALQQLAGQGVAFLMTLPIQPLRWPRKFSKQVARRFFAFGWRITIYQAHYGLQICLIRLMIFPRYGDIGVALYGRAWQMRELVGQNLACTFEVILTPLIARGKEDIERLRDLYVRGSIAVLAFCSFGAAVLSAVVPDLVRVFLGRNWVDVPELLSAMAPGLVVLGMTLPGIILGVALSATKTLIRFAVLSLGILALSMTIYHYTDLWHFTLAHSLLMIFPALYLIRWGTRITQLSARRLIHQQLPIIAIAFVTFLAMYFVRVTLMTLEAGNENLLHALARLVVCGITGLLFGWVLFAVFDRRNYRALLNLVVRGKESPIEAQDAIIALGHAEDPMDSGNG